jgi:hypothetical protein
MKENKKNAHQEIRRAFMHDAEPNPCQVQQSKLEHGGLAWMRQEWFHVTKSRSTMQLFVFTNKKRYFILEKRYFL